MTIELSKNIDLSTPRLFFFFSTFTVLIDSTLTLAFSALKAFETVLFFELSLLFDRAIAAACAEPGKIYDQQI